MESPGVGKKVNWAKAGIYSVIGIELALAHQ
jgi:hypothetical protein